MSRIEITPIGAPSLLSITGRWRKLPATMSERQSVTRDSGETDLTRSARGRGQGPGRGWRSQSHHV